MGSAVAIRPESHVFEETRAGIEYTSEVPLDLDSSNRTTLLTVTSKIGELLTEAELSQGQPYQVTNEDINRLGKRSLSRGLYLYPKDPRLSGARELVSVKAQDSYEIAEDAGLTLPFQSHFDDQPSVVFPASEFPKVGLAPAGIVRRAQANTQNKNAHLNRDETRKIVDKSARGVLRTYIEGMDALESKYIRDYDIARSLFKQTRNTKTPQNQYRTDNLVQNIVRIDGVFRQMIEAASINNKWSNQDVIGANHALNKMLYTNNSLIDNRLGWRVMLEAGAKYVNARRFKLLQARSNCVNHLTLHAKAPSAE